MSPHFAPARWRALFYLLCIPLSLGFFGVTSAQAQGCPNFALSGQSINGDANSFWTPQSFNVTAGGNVDLSTCGIGGHGFVITNPDFELSYNSANMGRDLEFRVTGTCDTVLLVNDANGQWQFSDDADGSFNPRLRLANASSGTYDIWVGTFSQGNCGATLAVETFGGGGFTPQPQPQPQPQPAGQCPDFSLSGQSINGDANSFWTPQSFNVTAGGNVDLSTCGIGGHGFVITNPDFELSYNSANMGRDLEFRVTGTCDTVLLVNDANGQWQFSDDADGTTNPRLRLANASSGTYDIWVGTFGQSTCGATLAVETFGGFTQQPPVFQPPVFQPPVVQQPPVFQPPVFQPPVVQQPPVFQPPVVQPPFAGNLPNPFSRVVFPDPGSLTAWRGRNGQIASFAVTGSTNGTVWGTDIYTDDSSLAAAAVHAGLLLPGQTGIVTVVIRPGQNAYSGTPRNGAQSQNFGAWSGSFSFVYP